MGKWVVKVALGHVPLEFSYFCFFLSFLCLLLLSSCPFPFRTRSLFRFLFLFLSLSFSSFLLLLALVLSLGKKAFSAISLFLFHFSCIQAAHEYIPSGEDACAGGTGSFTPFWSLETARQVNFPFSFTFAAAAVVIVVVVTHKIYTQEGGLS